jgi:methylenetetrahydrofolate dehydrogenase (NADP+)/methenyltetrahydrofolate cyclohydrolase
MNPQPESAKHARLLDGKALAQRIRDELAAQLAGPLAKHGRAPCLAVVRVGDDPASEVYVRNKHKACTEVGIESRRVELPASAAADALKAVVDALNADPVVDGILVQLPLPDHIAAAAVRSWVDPTKDVDALHPENAGLLAAGEPRFIPCTPAGCLELLRANGIETSGRRAVVIGRSLIVGRPMSILLSLPGIDATVTVCHSRTTDLAAVCGGADIIIAAAGKPELLRAAHVRPGAAVVDVGIHRVADASRKSGWRLVGDVHPEVAEVAGYLSPVPGGVGPMTIAMLLRNAVESFQRRIEG